MSVQGCIKALGLACCALAVAGCTRDGFLGFSRTQPEVWSQAPLYSQPAQDLTAKRSSDTADTLGDTATVLEEVREYIDTFPTRKAAQPATQTQVGLAQAIPTQPGMARFGDQSTSMSPVSLDQVRRAPNEGNASEVPALPVLTGVSVQALASAQTAPDLPETATANRPVEVGQMAPQASIGREIEGLEKQIREHPNDLNKQLRLRYLYLAEGLTDKALSLPEEMDPERAILLMKMIKSTIAAQNSLRDPTMISDEAVKAVEELRDWIQSHADLQIGRVALCTSIHSFGRYQTVADDFFVSGGPNRAFLYCEVRNFASESIDDGKYRTRLAHRLELLTPQGHSIWKDPKEVEVVDICMNQRKDFFFNRLVQMPLGINPGSYVLKVTVEDKIRARVDEASLKIEIKPAGWAGK